MGFVFLGNRNDTRKRSGVECRLASGLVTIDGAMLALIDLPNLLTATAAELKVNATLN